MNRQSLNEVTFDKNMLSLKYYYYLIVQKNEKYPNIPAAIFSQSNPCIHR